MTTDHLGDMRRQAVHDGVGDEDPSEVMGREGESLAVSVRQAGAGQGIDQQFPDRGRRERAVLGADVALEQQRHRRIPDLSRTS
ncbi:MULTISPECIES: hypothetical protein [Streptomyces]|uniref:hypothetical protein n=1 Tax=Streptomyces TaxID=1883 RepID=UPI00225759E5|nr:MULTISPECIES: hypothetical protein [Streptomyces]MCX5444400.1 hypothetical protein [Streptomyces libani]WDT52698.1 hypothetical protein NUT86_00905 [Streptomyces sp. G7(2002)]